MPRITGRKIYKPANIQTNPVPHTEKPTATKAILTTNFMLIGRLLPCFLFFSILLIISDFFFAVSEPVYWPYVSDTSKGRCNPSKTNFWRTNTLARSMRERGRFFTNQFGDGIRRNTFVSQTWGQTVHRQYHRWTRKKLYGEKFREKEIDLIFSIWCIFFVFWEVLERIGYLCKCESIVFKNAGTCVNLKGKKDNFNIEFTNVLNIAFTNVRRLLRK